MPSLHSAVARRRHTLDEKRHIVELSLQEGARVREIAQAHGICLTTLVNWRKSLREEQRHSGNNPCDNDVSQAKFLPVNIVMPTSPQPNRILVRIEFPSGASAHIQSDAFDARDLATLLASVQ